MSFHVLLSIPTNCDNRSIFSDRTSTSSYVIKKEKALLIIELPEKRNALQYFYTNSAKNIVFNFIELGRHFGA